MLFFKKLLSDKIVEKKYISAGEVFGDAVSYLYMGECIGFEKLFRRWAAWEKEYARRGYRTISLDHFVDAGGWGKSLDTYLGQKLNDGDESVLHAEIYRTKFLGKIKPVINLEQMMKDGRPQSGVFNIPSTKK